MWKTKILSHLPQTKSYCWTSICTHLRQYQSVLFRLRRGIVTYERHTSPLRVSVGVIGRQVLRTCRSTVLGPRSQCSGKRRHHGWEDVVQSEREFTVSAQSQVSSTVPTVSWCTGQLWTATCPQCHRCTRRFVDLYSTFHSHTENSRPMCSTVLHSAVEECYAKRMLFDNYVSYTEF